MLPISDLGREAVVVTSVVTALAVIIVLLRLYTRLFIICFIGIEDYIIAAATICSCVWAISVGIQGSFGLGQHVQDVGNDDQVDLSKDLWAGLIFYNLSLGLTKASLLVQYLRVFQLRKFRIACWCVLAVLVVYTIWSVLGHMFTCIPIRAFWTLEPGRCMNLYVIWFCNAGVNIATDLAIIILPMPVVSKLQLPRRQKQALMLVFVVGGLVCIISILRLRSLFAIINSVDWTYYDAEAQTWSSVEINVGIICSCLPVLRPLMVRLLPGLRSARSKNSASVPLEDRNVDKRRSGPIGSLYAVDARDEDVEIKETVPSKENRGNQIQVVTVVDVQSDGSNYEDVEDAQRAAGSSTEILVKDAGRIV